MEEEEVDDERKELEFDAEDEVTERIEALRSLFLVLIDLSSTALPEKDIDGVTSVSTTPCKKRRTLGDPALWKIGRKKGEIYRLSWEIK